MANQMPIYSHVVPKSQHRGKTKNGTRERNTSSNKEFDPLNFNNGGNFITGKQYDDKEGRREARKEDSSRRKGQRVDPNEGKVEAYLRQNQMSIRQQQHRHSAIRQAEHRVNLRSLPLTSEAATRQEKTDRTPTERHRAFPGDKDGNREHRREREGDRETRERERDFEFDASPLSPMPTRPDRADRGDRSERPIRKSSSSHRVEAHIAPAPRRFHGREWVFQKIAHCLEQRPSAKCYGAVIVGNAGSGKTAICRELSAPRAALAAPAARQQRALSRRLLAAHFLQSNIEGVRPAEFVRSLAMQILSHSQHARGQAETEVQQERERERDRNSEEENLIRRFRELGDDGEDSSKPLLGDSDEDEPAWSRRTMDRLTEKDSYVDAMPSTESREVPEVLPRSSVRPTNPFLIDDTNETDTSRVYENHENLFLRNISQRQSKESRNSRLVRQSSEPLNEKKHTNITKSMSTDSDNDKSKIENSPPKSRIPVSNFKYPHKTELKSSSNENSPLKKQNEDDIVEYQNVIEGNNNNNEDVPPPIPTLPISPRTLIANAYYDMLLSDREIQEALLPQNLEKDPEGCFNKAIVAPLLKMEAPKHCLFMLIDAVDDVENTDGSSVSILQLVLNAPRPTWLRLVLTRRPAPHTSLTGFKKISLDELQRSHVAADVQRYVLARLDAEHKLRARVSSEPAQAAAAAAAIDHLRIKSDGCLLYLEKVLDGVAEGFIALREIKEIPGTLNGLYLWLAQRLFHTRRFAKVRLLLDVLLAARCGVTEEMLYKCLLTKEYSVTREDFNRRLHLLRRVVVSDGEGTLQLFHHSFARWLRDVKHCTRRYLCSPPHGHAALAMCHSLHGARLTPFEVHDFVYHMMALEPYLQTQKKGKHSSSSQQDSMSGSILDAHTLALLWVLDSGCDVHAALRRAHCPTLAQVNDSIPEEKEGEMDMSIGDSEAEPTLATIMPELCVGGAAMGGAQVGGVSMGVARLPADARVLKALMQLTAKGLGGELTKDDCQPEEETSPLGDDTAPTQQEEVEEEEPDVDPALVHELAARGDDEAVDMLKVLLKRHPSCTSLQDSTGGTALLSAARAGRVTAVTALLSAGADIDVCDRDGCSALRAAAAAGHCEVVDLLIKHGCDVDSVDADNRTALRAASWAGHLSIVHTLLKAGASVTRTDGAGRGALLAAAYMGHADVVAALLDAGAPVDDTDHDGRTALSVACLGAGGARVVSLLAERGASVDLADRDGATPLIVAAFEGRTEICEILLEAEADIEASDSGGRSALWAACGAGHVSTVRLLLYWGAGVDSMDSEGRTVLAAAAAHGNVEVVRQLLDRGLDEHHRDNSGWTPLHYAAFEGHIEVCAALIEAGASVDARDNDGKSALHLAAGEGHATLCSELARWGASLELRAHDRRTPLRAAAAAGNMAAVRALRSLGARPDARDADGRSVLYALALDDRRDVASYLLSRGDVELDARDAEGRSALHVAAWQGHAAMVELLVNSGAELNARDRSQRTPLHCAAWRGQPNAARVLLRLGADPGLACAQGATALGIAAQEGHKECVMILLEYGADPLQADHCGRTPSKVAWRAGHTDISRLLDERASAPSAPTAPIAPIGSRAIQGEAYTASPEVKRRVTSRDSARASNYTDILHDYPDTEASRANMSLSFVQQVTQYGRRARERDSTIPDSYPLDKDGKIGYPPSCGSCSPLYMSPARSPPPDYERATGITQAANPPSVSEQHFSRDTHMRIILGRDSKPDKHDSKSKRNGIVTNPAMRLVANVRNGLDTAAANIRRTGAALSGAGNNPAVKTNAFHWRRETPL